MTRALLDATPADLPVSKPYRRRVATRRTVASGVGAVWEIIGPISAGVEVVGLTNGQFSLIDIIEHVLTEIGPADLSISTWTMGIYDAQRALAFCANGQIKSARWIVDPSFFGRRPAIAGPLVKRFGLDSFRAVNTHAKFCTLVNERFAVVVRTSMNLNPNNRLENFDLSEDRAMADWFNSVVDDVFGRYQEGEGGTQSRAFFAGVLSEFEEFEAKEAPKVSFENRFPGLKVATMADLATKFGPRKAGGHD